MYKLYLPLAMLFLLAACTPAKKESAIVGTWKLVEFADRDSIANPWKYPFGKNPRGYFTYTANHIVNLNISNESPLEISPDSLTTTAFVYRDLINNSVGYFGKYELKMEDSLVIHKVEGGDRKTWKRVLVRLK